jgi:hypothetical protein
MGYGKSLTMSLSVLFQSEHRAKHPQNPVDRHANGTRTAVEVQER